jgi:predicted Zn-dependent peptidase
MIHTVKIDDKTPKGKSIINELLKYPKIVKFVNPEVAVVVHEGYVTSDEFENKVNENISTYSKENSTKVVVPEGYLTGEEFFTGIKKELQKRCLENGLLQQNSSK